jgi:hypothetical protein
MSGSWLREEWRDEDDFAMARQRVVRRNWLFSSIPAALLLLSFSILVWEVLRQNMDATKWPWKLALLGVAPSATLSGVFTSLLVAREQFARSMRPNLSWSSLLRENAALGGKAWTSLLMNFGPGIANIVDTRYSLVIGPEPNPIKRFGASRRDAALAMAEAGFKEGIDFHFKIVADGAPLPVVKHGGEAMEFAAIRDNVLLSVRRLDFHVTVVDMMGDVHEKGLPFVSTLHSAPERTERQA